MLKQFRNWIRSEDDLESARRRTIVGILIFTLFVGFIWWIFYPFRLQQTLLVVSYDATREYFEDINAAYSAQLEPSLQPAVAMSHAGSVKQAQTVARGLVADVVNFASAPDIESVVRKNGGIAEDWRDRFPFRGSPYTSTIVFVVRAGNPKNIRDWADLLRPDVRIASPSPQVSGAGQYAYLAAVAFTRERQALAGRHPDGAARAFEDLVALYTRVEFIKLGARQALDVFRRQTNTDVFLTWESEALRLDRLPSSDLQAVFPSTSILAEPVVAIVDPHVKARQTAEQATRYIDFLYSPEGQAIAARNGLRPRSPQGIALTGLTFPEMRFFSLREVFGSDEEAWREQFSPDGAFAELLRIRAARRGGVD